MAFLAMVLAVLIVTSSPSARGATGQSSPPDALVGCWRYSNGLVVKVDKDGTMAMGQVKGKWRPADATKRVYVWTWPEIQDNAIVSADGKTLTETNPWFTLNATRMAGESGIVGMWQWPGGALILTIRPDNTFTAGPISGRWQAANLGDRNVHVDLAAADPYGHACAGRAEVLRRRPVREPVCQCQGIVSGRLSRQCGRPVQTCGDRRGQVMRMTRWTVEPRPASPRHSRMLIQWYRHVAVYHYQHSAVGGSVSRPHATRGGSWRAPGVARARGCRGVPRPSPAVGNECDTSSGSGRCAHRQHPVRAG